MTMELKFKSILGVAVLSACTFVISSCGSDDNKQNPEQQPQGGDSGVTAKVKLSDVNADFVNKTVIPTYVGLMKGNEELCAALSDINDDADVQAACAAWKEARQYWEWSEAFLFGAASSYGIDPHTDTWPFDKSAFDNYMAKFDPVNNEADAATLAEAIATGQNLTGFHAVEYLLFREGQPRKFSDMTPNEIWFCQTAARDLYLNSIKLVAAWGGELSANEAQDLADAEMEPDDNFGQEMINAGKAGSRWSTELAGTKQIIGGCQNILDEVAHAKIGAPYTGEDVDYIESPHAYNSIQDFLDNTLSCVYALYGGLGVDAKYTDKSVMAYAYENYPKEAAAMTAAMNNTVAKVKAMKKPFVLYYSDASAGEAIAALEAFDEALGELYAVME